MKQIFLSAILSLSITSTFAVTVMGSRSCGNWIESRTKQGIPEVAANSWLVGYLSGLAMESNKDVLASPDASSLYLWIDKYCRDNPLDWLDKAGYILFLELTRKNK